MQRHTYILSFMEEYLIAYHDQWISTAMLCHAVSCMACLNRSITLSFLIVEHTKFSPDWCFGLFKQAYWWTRIGSLNDTVRVVESAAVNHAQLIGTQDGKVIVPTYDLASFFDEPFRQRALKGIKLMHHLMFTHGTRSSRIVWTVLRENCR